MTGEVEVGVVEEVEVGVVEEVEVGVMEEVQVGVVEEVEVGVWRLPAGARAATGLSEPVIPVRVLMNGNSPEKVRSRYISKWIISRTI